MSGTEASFINPVNGAKELLQLNTLKLSKEISKRETITKDDLKNLFSDLIVSDIKSGFTDGWKSIDIKLSDGTMHAARVRVSIAHDATKQAVAQKIEAPFLGISGPVFGLQILKNTFSDYTASLDKTHSFVVSARASVVVFSQVNFKEVTLNGIEINRKIMNFLF